MDHRIKWSTSYGFPLGLAVLAIYYTGTSIPTILDEKLAIPPDTTRGMVFSKLFKSS